MIYDQTEDNGKHERELKRQLDQVFNTDDGIGSDEDYSQRRDQVHQRKQAKRLAKLQKKLRCRKVS